MKVGCKMDAFYNVNIYHPSHIQELEKLLLERQANREAYERVVRMLSDRFFKGGYTDMQVIERIQKCLNIIREKYPGKIYGYQSFVDFMSKMHRKRVGNASAMMKDYVDRVCNDPSNPVGYGRKLQEYNSLVVF
jgi:hypothetical protein